MAAEHAACEAAEAAAAARAAAIAEAAAAARAAAIAPPPQQLMLSEPPEWLANSDGPGVERAKNAAQDEFDALHLLWHNTGLGTQRVLFELHHCHNTLTPAQRNKLIDDVKLDVQAETEAPTHSAMLCGTGHGGGALCFNGSQTLKDKLAIA